MSLSDDLNLLLQAVLNIGTLTDEDRDFKIYEAKDWFETESDKDLMLPARLLLEDNAFMNKEAKAKTGWTRFNNISLFPAVAPRNPLGVSWVIR